MSQSATSLDAIDLGSVLLRATRLEPEQLEQARDELAEPALVGGIPALLALIHAPRARIARWGGSCPINAGQRAHQRKLPNKFGQRGSGGKVAQ